jgi:hypothetical protein
MTLYRDLTLERALDVVTSVAGCEIMAQSNGMFAVLLKENPIYNL